MSEYDTFAKDYTGHMGKAGDFHHRTSLIPAIRKLIGNIKNKKILDICCGSGYMDILFAKEGAKITGADYSKKLIEIAQKNAKGMKIKYLVHDAADLKSYCKYYKKNYFDLAICNMAIFHLQDIESFIKGISSVLKPGGKFIFSTNHPFRPDYPYSDWVKDKLNGNDVLFIKTTGYLINRKITGPSRFTKDFTETTRYHRPLSEYINTLAGHNLYVDGMIEPESVGFAVAFSEKLRKTPHIPTFIIISTVKLK